jgi:hypothetical protein
MPAGVCAKTHLLLDSTQDSGVSRGQIFFQVTERNCEDIFVMQNQLGMGLGQSPQETVF